MLTVPPHPERQVATRPAMQALPSPQVYSYRCCKRRMGLDENKNAMKRKQLRFAIAVPNVLEITSVGPAGIFDAVDDSSVRFRVVLKVGP